MPDADRQTYELAIGGFRGPLEKLLELIEERQLEITTVSLAQVTDDFLSFLKVITPHAQENTSRMRLLADFIAVASKLILIKSKGLIPDLPLTQEEEADIKDLEGRLKLYKEFKRAGILLGEQYHAGNHMGSRPYLMSITGVQGMFYPGANVSLATLAQSLRTITDVVKRLTVEEETIKDTIISIEEKIQHIVTRLTDRMHTQFAELSHGASRSELIALFLAILHLAREQRVWLEQEHPFSDILVSKRT